MVSQSITLMTMVDILIVAVFACALWVFRKYTHDIQEREKRIDFLLIALGMGVISLFYIIDFIAMHIAPIFMPYAEAMGMMSNLQSVFEWYLAPIGIILVIAGFSRSLLHTASMHRQIKQNEGRLEEAAADARTALDKLNEREIELKQQNANFQLALENMSQGLCVFDKNERLVVSNDKYATLYRLDKKLIKPGTPFQDILDFRIKNNVIMGDDPGKYIKERVSAVSQRKPTTTIQRLTDGRVIVIAHCPLPDGGWVATHEDITDLAKSESMNQRLARIVENSINEVYVFDADTLKFQQVNRSACENLGYSMQDLRELTPLDLKRDHTRESFEKLIAPLRDQTKRHIQFEATHTRKDGSIYDVHVTLQQISSQNEIVFAAVIEDLTERKRINRDLKRSQELFSKAFHANPIPFSISGPEGEIHDVNEAWLKTLGYTREEAIGNSALKLGVWADPSARGHFVELLLESGSVENYETQYATKDGELRDMIVSGESLEIRGELRMFNISHDVTERKANERRLLEDRDTLQDLVKDATRDLSAKAKELEAALAREKELNELQRQFVSMASHEFRTPLAIIDSTAQRMKKNVGKETDDSALRRIEKIRLAVKRMTRLMESTLTAARLEEGKIDVEMRSCNIAEIISDVCTRQKEIAASHDISIEMDGLPVQMIADANAIDQILTNLLSNAIKYSPDSPKVEVKAFAESDEIVLQVSDRGLGIDEDDLPNMFSRFFRAKTSSGIAGTGIGLNLVKKLVELHDGTVSVKSMRNAGSTFTIRLPVNGPQQPEKAA